MKKIFKIKWIVLITRIFVGIILLWIIMRSGIVGSVMYWAGLEKSHIKIDIQEVYDMNKMPFGGYYPTFQVSSAAGKTILVTTTRGKVLNVTKCEKRTQAGEKIMPLRTYALSKGNASFWWGSDSEKWWNSNDTYSIYVTAQKYGVVLERRRFWVKKYKDKKYLIKGKNITKTEETGALIVDRRKDVQRITDTYGGETWETLKLDFNQLKRNASPDFEIARGAFRNCYELKNIVIENWNDDISLTIDKEAFLNCANDLTVYCPKQTKLQKRLQELGVRWKEYRKEDWEKIQGSPYVVMSTVYEVYNHGTLGEKVKLPAITKKVAEGAFSDIYRKKQVTSYQGRDRKKVKKHLEQYPMNFDDLKETDVFVNTSSYALRKEKLNDFIESVQRGENKSVDIVTFTIEGDPVLVYIQYNGKNFYCYESFENDSYAAKSARQFNEKNYKYMYLWDIPDEEFGDIDLSKMDTGFQQFVLSNEKLGDYSTFKKMKDDSYSIKVSPFNSEKAVKEYLQRSNK